MRTWSSRQATILVLTLLIAGVAVAVALVRRPEDRSPTPVTVTWDGSEGHPSCAYDAARRVVVARLRVAGHAPRARRLRIMVTAYADENTSDAVGSTSRELRVRGEVHRRLRLTIPVDRRPHRGEDGETACRLAVG